jgi:hypothetical protein
MKKLVFDRVLDSFERAEPVFVDLPQGELARELAEDALGGGAPSLPDGRWVVGVLVDGLRLFAAGTEDDWAIYRSFDADEADATAAASKLHAAIGSRHSEWDSDR